MTATVNTAPQRGPLAEKALAAGNRVGIKLIPHLPGGLKRLLSGGRAITIDGNTLDPSVQMMLAAQRATGVNGLSVADDVAATRQQLRETARTVDEPGVHAAEIRNLSIPGPAGQIPVRHYRPAGAGPAPLLVFYHGGGWVIGDLASHHPFCEALSEATGCSVIALDYRLAPEHPFPAAQDDCLAATHWIAGHSSRLGPNDGRLVLAGDSAGGNLAVCTCLALDAATRKHILGQVLIYPATDHYSAGFDSYVEKARGQLLTAAVVTWFWDTYLAGLPPDAPAAQRAFPRRSPNTGTLPPTLLVTAENDPLRDEGRAYAGQLGEAGVQVRFHHFDNAAHGFACSEGRSTHVQLFISQLTSWLSGLDKPIEERQL